MVYGLWFMVYGLGFRVDGLWLRVGSRFGVQGLGFRVITVEGRDLQANIALGIRPYTCTSKHVPRHSPPPGPYS